MNAGILDWEDHDIFFDTDDFAVEATLEFNAAPGETAESVDIVGILDTPYGEREYGAIVVDADNPSFTTKWTAAIARVRKGDYLIVGVERFAILSAPENDGTGQCDLPLVRESLQDTEGDNYQTEYPKTPDGKTYTRPNRGVLGKS